MTDARPGRRLAATAAATAALTALAVYGVFFVAPEDADQGIIQKIFYFHVAIAIGSLLAFLVACVYGIRYLRSRDERHDEVSSTAVGIGIGFAVLVVITGSIWAKASWGTWWVWTDPRLVTFLIVLLLYAAYFVLRSSAEGERRMRYSAIYSIAAFASVPLSFYSVRVARSFVHPVVFTQNGANMPDTMLVWFAVSQLAVIGVFLTIMQVELLQRRRRQGAAPHQAAPGGRRVSTGAQYVVAAYGVVLFGLLMYVLVLGLRTARLAREAELLARLGGARGRGPARPRAGGHAVSGNRVAPSRPPGPGKVFYPMFVDIEGRRCLVVGGGPVATEKVEKLLDHGAVVRLVTPAMTDELAAMVASGAVAEHRARGYAERGPGRVLPGDRRDEPRRDQPDGLAGRRGAEPALQRRRRAPALQLHRAVHRAPRRARPGRSRPAGPARWWRSTSAASSRTPTAPSGRRWSSLLRDVRDELKARYPDMPSRRDAVERLMETDVVRRLAEGDEAGARELATRVLDIGVPA